MEKKGSFGEYLFTSFAYQSNLILRLTTGYTRGDPEDIVVVKITRHVVKIKDLHQDFSDLLMIITVGDLLVVIFNKVFPSRSS